MRNAAIQSFLHKSPLASANIFVKARASLVLALLGVMVLALIPSEPQTIYVEKPETSRPYLEHDLAMTRRLCEKHPELTTYCFEKKTILARALGHEPPKRRNVASILEP